MSSRINIARPATSSYNSDPHGLSNSRPSSTGYRAANPDDPIEKIRAYSQTVEDYVEIYSQPLKPHLPAIGRFLIVVTFLEDALRIMTQWSDQIWYLQRCLDLTVRQLGFTWNWWMWFCRHRHFPWGISHFFLLINVIVCPGPPDLLSYSPPFLITDNACGFWRDHNKTLHWICSGRSPRRSRYSRFRIWPHLRP